MYDGLTINYLLKDFEGWKNEINLPFNKTTNDKGETFTKTRGNEIITTYWSKWETYELTVKVILNIITGKKRYRLNIRGSLHKNQYGGANYLPFTWAQVHQQVNHICNSLRINPLHARVSTLEVGVNIVTPFAVTPFILDNIICYKGDYFGRYSKDAKGICLGKVCETTHYSIKVYDKGVQYNLPYNLMRIEKKFSRMQELNKIGIKYLSDLLHYDKVLKLLPTLMDSWQNVLVYDITDKVILHHAETLLIINGQNQNHWEQLKDKNKRQYYYQLTNFKKLVAKHGNNWHNKIAGLIKCEWGKLFENCTNIQSGENTNVTKIDIANKQELYKSTIKIKMRNVQNRFCQSCGKEITSQKKDSKFCSAKYVSYQAAHQCRNNINNQKYKIEKIQRRGVLFDITPFFIPR